MRRVEVVNTCTYIQISMHSTYKLNHGGVGGDMEGREEAGEKRGREEAGEKRGRGEAGEKRRREEAGEKRGRGEAGEKRGREEAGENPDATTSLQGMSACLNPKP